MKRPLIAAALAFQMAAHSAAAAPEAFQSPEAAVDAVVAALEARDVERLKAIFGPENEDVILSGDAARDREDWGSFLEAWREMNRIAEPEPGRARVYVGRDQWPFPVDLTSVEGGWAFDADTAREEILHRRIGRNELDVIELARAYVRVQADYRRTDWDDDGVMEFAAHLISSPGARDGLYWPSEPGAPESPVGDFVARAAAQGYVVDGATAEPEPYLGYYFMVLPAQGPSAPGDAYDYVIGGNMVAGHALLAVPADYGSSGVMSFLVAENGVVFEADLGEDTLDAAADISAFDPAEGWSPVED